MICIGAILLKSISADTHAYGYTHAVHDVIGVAEESRMCLYSEVGHGSLCLRLEVG